MQIMILQTTVDESEAQIRVNSFYDVFEEDIEDEAEEYKELVGLPMVDTLEELLKCLK